MKAIILAAGYATRLYPLTMNMPKALLEIGDKPIISYIVDEINTIDAVDNIYVVTNHKFENHFQKWAEKTKSKKQIIVIDDGTATEETRRGAIGDILFAIDKEGIDDEIIIIAGDNFFTYKLKDYYDFYKSKNMDCICVKEIHDIEQLKQFGVALLDENEKVIGIEEKPANPKSNTAVFATYMYKKETILLFKRYIEEGNKLDAPGYFLEWLYKIKDVFAYKFNGECYDIGTPQMYEEICSKFKK